MKVHTKLLHSVYDQCIQLVTKKKELDYNLVFNKYYYQITFRALNFTSKKKKRTRLQFGV